MSLITDPNPAPAGSQPPAGQQSTGTSGSQTPPAGGAFDYRSVLPEDLRSAPTFEPYAKVKDQTEFVQQLARGYHSAQGLIGKKGLLPPGENATPEERLAFRKEATKAMGVPEKLEDYKVALPEGANLDPVKVQAWTKNMHLLGVPPENAAKIIESYVAEQKAEADAEAQKLQGWENETKQRLGANFDRDLNFARAALREFDKEGKLGSLLEETGLGSHPEVITLLSKMGTMISERGPRGEGGAPQSGLLSPDQAQVEIAQFERQHREALFSASHADHDFAVKRRAELYRAAFPIPATKTA